MLRNYLLPLFACAVLLAAGCANVGVSGQGGSGSEKSGGGSVSFPIFTSLNLSEKEPLPIPALRAGR